jgi:hypothetical protein
MKRETWLLKTTIFLIGSIVLAMCIFIIPKIAQYAASLFPDGAFIQLLVMLVPYVTAIPFYFGLFQAYRLLQYIDHQQAFAEGSVLALRNIRNSAFVVSTLYVCSMPLFYFIADADDAPGVIIIVMMVIVASIVIAVFAAVLQKLLQQAIAIKSENDLTV